MFAKWPRTEAEIQALRSAMSSVQAIAHDMIFACRQNEVDEIRRQISIVAPALSHRIP